MKPIFKYFLCLTAGILLAATSLSAAAPVTPANATPVGGAVAAVKTVDRFERTKQRIDALLKRRITPEALPAILPNPFQLSEETPVASSTHVPGAVEQQVVVQPKVDVPAEFLQPGSDEETLSRYLPTLRISGTGQLNGRAYLIINSTPYREGDRILVSNKAAQIYFQVLHIAVGEVTFGLNDAQQVLKFKN